MKILVTGGAGFIGSHIVEHFQRTARVLVLDNLRSGFRRNLEGLNCEFVEGSILDNALVRELMHDVDYVFHLAAMVSVPESVANPVECEQLNTEGTLIVLDAAAKAGVSKLCFSSSSAVYGEPGEPRLDANERELMARPISESMPPEPKSPYAVSKLAAESYCRLYAREGWLATVCLRYFNVFGPHQDPKSAYAAVIPAFITRALDGEDLEIYGDGGQTRDFVYVKDVAAANAHLAQSAHTGSYNVASGRSLSINELAQRIIDLTAAASQLRHLNVRPGDIRHSHADINALRAAGFTPAVSLETGLRQTIAAFQTQA